jgi:DNA-binding NarL/FixJ family response regulator
MRIIIADDQSQVRFALRVALEHQPGFKTIGEAADAPDLLAQAQALCPDLVLLDWDLPGVGVVDLMRALRKFCPRARVIALGSEPATRAAALAAGVNAFISKSDPPDELLAAIDACWDKSSARRMPSLGLAMV